MKNLLWLIWTMLLLVAMVTGCIDTRYYDSRLVAADSLMNYDPDSAFVIIEGVNVDSLANEGERAYHDLLLTQARYKCYEEFTDKDDSIITQTLNYYCRHSGEREKLTRAYIYKGAVMEELGHPDSAMFYYKQSEENASRTDFNNLGYAKLQMGALYNKYYTMDGKEIEKYKEALECYRNTQDTIHLMVCMNNLGCLFRETRPKEAESLLLEASQLARHWNDTSYIITNTQALVVLYYHCQRYNEARQLLWDINSYQKPGLDYKLYFTAASVYSKLGILDTAEMYIDFAKQNFIGDTALFDMYRLGCLSDLALARHDTVTALSLDHESEVIADSLRSNKEKLEILNADNNYEKEQTRRNQDEHDRTIKSYQWIILAVVLALLLSLVYYYCKVHRYDRLILDLKKETEDQADNLRLLQNNIDELEINDEGLKDSITSHITLLQEVIQACYHAPKNVLAKSIRQLVKFQESNKDVWTRLYQYIDKENNGIMSYTMNHYPQLGDKDLLMIALTCMGYSCAQIAIVLDYSNATSISTIRTRIATKMGLDCSLDDYIQPFKESHQN